MPRDSKSAQPKPQCSADERSLLTLLPRDSRIALLDIGCGAGEHAALLRAQAGRVVGLDMSPEAIAQAKMHFPDVEFYRLNDLSDLTESQFDVVYSYDTFQKISDHAALLQQIHRVLKAGGTLLCEFGVAGNLKKIEHAIEAVMGTYGHLYTSRFTLPTAERFREMLAKQGFLVDELQEYDCPLPLEGGKTGLRDWICRQYASELAHFRPLEREEVFAQVENFFCADLWDSAQWIVDCRHLRLKARKA